jgi:amino acid transporter
MSSQSSQKPPDLDKKVLHEFGYAQQLLRDMGGFSNFAISFSIISILTGAVTLYGVGLNGGGPVIMGIGWPLVTLFVLFVAAALAELAYPDVWRTLPLGFAAWRACLGLDHGVAKPCRPGRGHRRH